MNASSARAQPVDPDDRQILKALTGDPEQRVIVSVLSKLATWRRADRAHPWVRHWGVPVFCAGLGVSSYANPYNIAPVPLQMVLLVAFCVPLLWRERHPMLVFAVVIAVSVATLPLGVLTGAEVAQVVALFNVGRYCTPRQLVVAMSVTTAQLVALAVVFWQGRQLEFATRPEVVSPIAVAGLLAFALLGLLTRLAHAYAVALRKEGERQAHLAVAQERARVSREMHDILGHTLAVIVGLADGAAALAATKPERGAQTLRIIGDNGREALAELRRLLSVISEDDGQPQDAPLAPQPGLVDLDALLERVRTAGPTVVLDSQGDLTGMAPGLQLSIYRIIQEALTNTVKYAASDTTVHVGIAADPDAVCVTVDDAGPSRARLKHRPSTGGGRGLVGMRERATLYDGEVTAGPNGRGGWTVQALLVPNPSFPERHPA
ncbi:MAG TPA: histidine kinase [Kineosporiaceae bacterium]|nr:histidine kinase [Kineosporiaceae bacterium]